MSRQVELVVVEEGQVRPSMLSPALASTAQALSLRMTGPLAG